MNMVRVK